MGESTDGESEDMAWQDVTRKRKNRSTSSESSALGLEMGDVNKKRAAKKNGRDEDEQAEWKVLITFKKEGVHFHPLKLTKAIEKEMGKIKFAKFLSNRRLLIFAKDKLQREKFLQAETLNGEQINAHNPGNAAKMKGVIYDVPLTMTMDEIMQEVKGGKVLKATRLQMHRRGVKSDSFSVLLEFEKSMPKKIRMGYLSYDVREYIPAPLRCFKCQRMGHTAGQCKGKPRCARCGGEHEYGKCGKDAKIKCCNCGGEHSAAFGGCPVQRQAREIQKYKISNPVSYADAAKKVKEIELARSRDTVVANPSQSVRRKSIEIPARAINHEQTEINPWVKKIKEDTLIMDKISFIAFLCKIVNVAMQQQRKSDRIKTVMEAATELLGIKDIKAEMIHEMLNHTNYDGLSQGD
ncbi:Nucleic-acid-binding protein from mobile element jockey [Labeo rohita]|uniref:Nucleic-acid-binding protein from mobile element jockey n=1 Tax=Labeo rohita TaxID=84645 RepID=A0ABQ8LZC7_LABRO|nr:Nucleic-acid-binding protein from mobile element jockey [Labeo rohita]